KPTWRALSGPLTTLLTRTPLRAGTTILITTPLFHGFGLAFLLLSLFLGATVVLRRRITPEQLPEDIARHRVEVLTAVPTVIKRLLELPEAARAGRDHSSLRAVLSSGAALGPGLSARLME